MTWSAAMAWCSWSSLHWPVAEGEVVSTWVRETRGRTGQLFYLPKVEYRYAVGTESYTGRRRGFSALPDSHVSSAAAYDALAGLAPGSRVAVFYHPHLPHLAVVRPGVSANGESFGLFALGAVLTFSGIRW